LRQPARPIHSSAVTRAARPLEALAAGVAVLLMALLATGGWTIGGLPLTRADELVMVLAALVALRALVAPLPELRLSPARAAAAGALAVFGYATRRLGAAPAAGAFALLYLVNPSLHGINVRDIHPQAFAITLIIAAALAFDAQRYAWCAVALALTLACREDAA